MAHENERSYEITLPYIVYEAMALCYYGGGPRHRTAPNPEAQVTASVDEVAVEPLGPVTFDEDLLRRELSRTPPMRPVSSFAKKKTGVTDQKPVSSSTVSQETNDASSSGRTDQPSDQEA